jgi:hypothetical protein
MSRLVLLAILALALVILAVLRARKGSSIAVVPLLAVTASVALFAITIRPLGLVAATLIGIAALNVADLRGRTTAVLLAMLIGVVAVVALTMLGELPISLWPRLGGA